MRISNNFNQKPDNAMTLYEVKSKLRQETCNLLTNFSHFYMHGTLKLIRNMYRNEKNRKMEIISR